MKKLIYFILVISLFICCGPKEGKVEKIMVDGVAHIINPEKPLKETVLLDVEKTREINPYIHEEVGIKYLSFIRDKDGQVILFDSGNAEAQMFNRNGEYMGSLFRKGQGPGEFPERRMFNACFMNNQIWATGDMKFAKYDKNGQFLYEQKIGYRPDVFVDENTFLETHQNSSNQVHMVVEVVHQFRRFEYIYYEDVKFLEYHKRSTIYPNELYFVQNPIGKSQRLCLNWQKDQCRQIFSEYSNCLIRFEITFLK